MTGSSGHVVTNLREITQAAVSEMQTLSETWIAWLKSTAKVLDHQKREEKKGKRGYADEFAADISSRPSRNARNAAINNIRKQTQMTLSRKLRRPGSDEVDDAGYISAVSAASGRTTTSSKCPTEEAFAVPVPVPRKRGRNDTETRAKNSSRLVAVEIESPRSVKETIKQFEEMNRSCRQDAKRSVIQKNVSQVSPNEEPARISNPYTVKTVEHTRELSNGNKENLTSVQISEQQEHGRMDTTETVLEQTKEPSRTLENLTPVSEPNKNSSRLNSTRSKILNEGDNGNGDGTFTLPSRSRSPSNSVPSALDATYVSKLRNTRQNSRTTPSPNVPTEKNTRRSRSLTRLPGPATPELTRCLSGSDLVSNPLLKTVIKMNIKDVKESTPRVLETSRAQMDEASPAISPVRCASVGINVINETMEEAVEMQNLDQGSVDISIRNDSRLNKEIGGKKTVEDIDLLSEDISLPIGESSRIGVLKSNSIRTGVDSNKTQTLSGSASANSSYMTAEKSNSRNVTFADEVPARESKQYDMFISSPEETNAPASIHGEVPKTALNVDKYVTADESNTDVETISRPKRTRTKRTKTKNNKPTEADPNKLRKDYTETETESECFEESSRSKRTRPNRTKTINDTTGLEIDNLDASTRPKRTRTQKKKPAQSSNYETADETFERPVKRTKNVKAKRSQKQSSKMSCSVDADDEVSRQETPKQNTRSSKRSADMADIFANVPVETAVKPKKPKRMMEVATSASEEEKDSESHEFQAPLPVAPASKRTKVVAKPKMYDAEGNLIDTVIRVARTKTLKAPTVDVLLPDADCEARPVRTRTKVRRFGQSGSENNPEQSDSESAERVTRTKTKARLAEIDTNKPQSAIIRKSKSRRASRVLNPTLLKKLKTPLSSAGKMGIARPVVILKENQQLPKKIAKVVPVKPNEYEEREAKFKTQQEKEKLAALKKQEELKKKRDLIKLKNEEKTQRAMMNRAKIEESRKFKLREMELEQEKILQEKQRQQEMEEKRARERMEEKRKLAEMEKIAKAKAAQARAQAERLRAEQDAKPYGNKYLPKNENDLGLEEENSEDSGGDEPPTPKKAAPSWVAAVRNAPLLQQYITAKQMALFMPIPSKTPNVHKMFNMSPSRRLKRTSSAIWNETIMSGTP